MADEKDAPIAHRWKVDFQLSGLNDNGQQFIRVREQKIHGKYGFAMFTKPGFVEVTPGKMAEATLEGLKTGEIGYVFGQKNRQTGLYEVKLIVLGEEEQVAAELEGEHADNAGALQH